MGMRPSQERREEDLPYCACYCCYCPLSFFLLALCRSLRRQGKPRRLDGPRQAVLRLVASRAAPKYRTDRRPRCIPYKPVGEVLRDLLHAAERYDVRRTSEQYNYSWRDWHHERPPPPPSLPSPSPPLMPPSRTLGEHSHWPATSLRQWCSYIISIDLLALALFTSATSDLIYTQSPIDDDGAKRPHLCANRPRGGPIPACVSSVLRMESSPPRPALQ